MNATYCIDERDKILELPHLLSDINWENAGRRFKNLTGKCSIILTIHHVATINLVPTLEKKSWHVYSEAMVLKQNLVF